MLRLNELLFEQYEKYARIEKARICYYKCLWQNKIELAIKIKEKYGFEDEVTSDLVTAFRYALIASNKLKK